MDKLTFSYNFFFFQHSLRSIHETQMQFGANWPANPLKRGGIGRILKSHFVGAALDGSNRRERAEPGTKMQSRRVSLGRKQNLSRVSFLSELWRAARARTKRRVVACLGAECSRQLAREPLGLSVARCTASRERERFDIGSAASREPKTADVSSSANVHAIGRSPLRLSSCPKDFSRRRRTTERENEIDEFNAAQNTEFYDSKLHAHR